MSRITLTYIFIMLISILTPLSQECPELSVCEPEVSDVVQVTAVAAERMENNEPAKAAAQMIRCRGGETPKSCHVNNRPRLCGRLRMNCVMRE